MTDRLRIFDTNQQREDRRVPPSETPEPETPQGRVIDAIKTVYDPEIPVNVYDLGLIYAIDITGDTCHIDMTLTSPACPEAQTLPEMVRKAAETAGVAPKAEVRMVWEPRWDRERMSDEAKLHLGLL